MFKMDGICRKIQRHKRIHLQELEHEIQHEKHTIKQPVINIVPFDNIFDIILASEQNVKCLVYSCLKNCFFKFLNYLLCVIFHTLWEVF